MWMPCLPLGVDRSRWVEVVGLWRHPRSYTGVIKYMLQGKLVLLKYRTDCVTLMGVRLKPPIPSANQQPANPHLSATSRRTQLPLETNTPLVDLPQLFAYVRSDNA